MTFVRQRSKSSEWDWRVQTQDVEHGLEQTKKNLPKALGLAIYRAGVKILETARPLTPKDTGQLRRSRFLTRPMLAQKGPFVVLGYGTRYAVAVHERTWVNYDPGQAKYLREAIRQERSGGLAKFIARQAWKDFELGMGFLVTPNSKFPTRPSQ